MRILHRYPSMQKAYMYEARDLLGLPPILTKQKIPVVKCFISNRRKMLTTVLAGIVKVFQPNAIIRN